MTSWTSLLFLILSPRKLLILTWLLSASFGDVLSQQIQNLRCNIGAISDSCPTVWPLAEATDWQSPADTSKWYGDSQIWIRAFASGQFSPNVRAFGVGTARSFAESIGWKAGMEMAGHFKRFKWNGMLDHWRLSNVSEADWNQAWQWGIWDGNGW